MNLQELRRGHVGLTQAKVAELLHVTQAAISQLEKREDFLLSSLAEYVKALGGRLEVVAHFEDGQDVRITQFEGVKEQLMEARG
jgi:transcriptional regulator with XRE-family HTH domain